MADAPTTETVAPTNTTTEPTTLPDDHPLVKAHKAQKADNASLKQRLSEMEAAGKTDAQKVAERIAKLEQENAASRAEALRMRIAAKHAISDEDAALFLTASDEETLTKQAKRLAEQVAAKKDSERKRSQVVSGEGNTTKPPSGDDGEMREFTRALFSRTDD